MPIGENHRRRLVGPTELSRLDRWDASTDPTVSMTAMTARSRENRSDRSVMIIVDATDANDGMPCRLLSPLCTVHHVRARESSASELATDSTCESSRVPI